MGQFSLLGGLTNLSGLLLWGIALGAVDSTRLLGVTLEVALEVTLGETLEVTLEVILVRGLVVVRLLGKPLAWRFCRCPSSGLFALLDGLSLSFFLKKTRVQCICNVSFVKNLETCKTKRQRRDRQKE